ncbi:MAG: DUF4198 domain-containing protein [Kiritimatiellae bacterium]|nr:DUF4198 domain-containing protein [Kiritimatiellia bacterium]MDW8459289.1 hypothetical protein [Verrucomicrobiota bacterium]
MKRLVVIALAAAAFSASAHEIWLDAASLRPEPGQPVELFIRCGHYFPASELAVADRLIAAFYAECAGAREELASTAEGGQRRALYTAPGGCAARLTLVLKRPHLEEPAHWASLILVPQNAQSEPADYSRGQGLEIVPLARVEDARRNEPFPLAVLRDGIRIRAKVQIMAAEGGTSWVETGADLPSTFSPRKSGRHLAAVSDRGQTATLVFDVSP